MSQPKIASSQIDLGISLSSTVIGAPLSNAKVMLVVAAQAFDISDTPSLTPSYGYADTTATADTDFDIQLNGLSVGTMAFAIGANMAIFTFPSPVSVALGDRISVVAPASPDSTLADIYFTIRGNLV